MEESEHVPRKKESGHTKKKKESGQNTDHQLNEVGPLFSVFPKSSRTPALDSASRWNKKHPLPRLI